MKPDRIEQINLKETTVKKLEHKLIKLRVLYNKLQRPTNLTRDNYENHIDKVTACETKIEITKLRLKEYYRGLSQFRY